MLTYFLIILTHFCSKIKKIVLDEANLNAFKNVRLFMTKDVAILFQNPRKISNIYTNIKVTYKLESPSAKILASEHNTFAPINTNILRCHHT